MCLLGALINADVALVSILPDERIALRIDRTIHFFFVFSIPIYISFVHAFLGIRGRRWLEITAWLFSIASLFLDSHRSLLSAGSITILSDGSPGPACSFISFPAAVAFTVIYCLAVLYRAMRESADNQQKNRIKYIFGGMGFSALLLALHHPARQRHSRLSAREFQLHSQPFFWPSGSSSTICWTWAPLSGGERSTSC